MLQYDDIVKKIKSGSFDKVYYLYGRDILSVENLTKFIISKVTKNGDESSFQKFVGKELSMEDLVDYSQMFPMMTEYNLIVINDLNAEEMTAENIKSFNEIIDTLPETTIILIYITGFSIKEGKKYLSSKNKKIIDYIAKHGTVCEMELKTVQELAKSVIKSAEKSGCSISMTNAFNIVQLCLCNSMMIKNELDKLCSYADKSEITADMISELVSKQLDSTVFNLAKAVSMFNTRQALTLLNELFLQQNNSLVILGAISNTFIDFYRAKTAISSGRTENDILSDYSYKGREFVVRNAMRDCRKISEAHLRKCLCILTDTEKKLKSFSGNERILIEQAIVSMTKN